MLAGTLHEAPLPLDAFFVSLTPDARLPPMRLPSALRSDGLLCDLDYADRSAKGQFRQADRSGAAFAVILGEDELARGICTLRDMSSGEEREVSAADGAKELLRAVAG